MERIDLPSTRVHGSTGRQLQQLSRNSDRKMETQAFTFATSRFAPVAIGFFGLGTGYFIWGGQALFGFPKTSPEVNRTMGM
jgi:nitrate reductase NapE component